MKPRIKKIRAIVYSMWQPIDRCLLSLASRSPFLSSLYYTFFSRCFRLEHQSVISGRLRYYHHLRNDSNPESALLRRNIHRLEKGLIMRPFRTVFATSYIFDTVKAFGTAMSHRSSCSSSSETLKWAHDVLDAYFSVTDNNHAEIKRSLEYFQRLPSVGGTTLFRPYYRDLSRELPVDYAGLLALSRQRRSVRWYRQEPVCRNKIDNAITVAALSPSACNRQPFEFRICDDPKMVEDIASIAMGTKGFSHNFPGIMVLVGDLSAYFHERDRHLIYIDSALAAMSLVYALEVQGISSCIINWPEIPSKEKKIKKKLKLKPEQRVTMMISYGYPDKEGMVPYSQKKNLNHLRSYYP